MTATKEKIRVPQEVFDGLEFVRKSGKTNMFDYGMVMRIAFEEGFFKTVDWLDKNKDLYGKGMFQGFEPE